MNAKLALLLASFAAVAVQARGPTRSDEGGAAPSGRLRVERGLESWRGVHGPEWRARYDERVQAARFVFGGSARAPVVPQLDEDYVALARYFLRASLDLHAIEPATLVPDRVVFLPLGLAGSTDKITVRFRQQVAGVPVIQGWVSVLFALDGTLLSIDSTALPAANGVATVPAYASDAAAERARARFRADSGLVPTRVTPPELFIDQVAVGKHLEPRLVWEVESHWSVPGTQPEGWIYRFDAVDGALVSRTSAIHTFDVSGNVKSMATPGHAPDTAANPEQAIDMPHLRVSSSQGSATTDANGNFTIAGATAPLNVTVSYDGTWAALTNVAQTDYSLTTSLARASGNAILMNPGASDPVTAEANAFNWIGRMRDWTRSVNPSDGTSDFLAAANVNLNDTCNAFYNGVSVNFYPAGGGCVNTSFSSVVLHEMGALDEQPLCQRQRPGRVRRGQRRQLRDLHPR